MLDPSLTIGPVTVRTYTLLLSLAIIASAGFAILRAPKSKRGARADVCLGGLVGGVLLARLIHVLLNWNYFAYNTGEITQLRAGGLDWHGAVVGALAGMALIARWRNVDMRSLLNALTPGLPLIAFAAWWGCGVEACAYGAETANLADYPAFAVWEGPDVFGIYAPRFNTQLVGIAVSALLLATAGMLTWRDWLPGRRFWLTLSLLGIVMFALGFLRGDYTLYVAGLRLDQWLDIATTVFAGVLAIAVRS